MDRAELVDGLRAYVARELLYGDADGLDERTPLLEWGVIDSLAMVGLLAFIEERWGVRVPDEEVRPEHFVDLGAIATLLARLPAGAPPAGAPRFPDPLAAARALEPYGVRAARLATPDGASVHRLEVDGPGPSWLFLPALGMAASSWGPLLRALAGERRAVAADLAGFGLSTAGGGATPGFDAHVAHAAALVDALDGTAAGGVVLAGSSAGALVAAEVARRRRGSVRALALSGLGLPRDPAAWWAELRALARAPERFAAAVWRTPPPLGDSARTLLAVALAAPAYAAFVEDAARAAAAAPFEGLDGLPVLFVRGDCDGLVSAEAVAAAAARVPGSCVETIARCGHLPEVERPQELLLVLRRFFDGATRA